MTESEVIRLFDHVNALKAKLGTKLSQYQRAKTLSDIDRYEAKINDYYKNESSYISSNY